MRLTLTSFTKVLLQTSTTGFGNIIMDQENIPPKKVPGNLYIPDLSLTKEMLLLTWLALSQYLLPDSDGRYDR
jgi:hypothetical protein